MQVLQIIRMIIVMMIITMILKINIMVISLNVAITQLTRECPVCHFKLGYLGVLGEEVVDCPTQLILYSSL